MKLTNKTLSLQAKQMITKMINEEYHFMDQIPSEQDLSTTLGVSRNTIREALKALENEGITLSRHGVGTFVIREPNTMKHNLAVLDSTTKIIESHGYQADTIDLENKIVPVWDDTAKLLGLENGGTSLYISRIRTADGRPLVYIEDYIPDTKEMKKLVAEYKSGSSMSLFALFHNHGCMPCFSNCNISAVISDTIIQEKLGLHKPTALLLLKQTHYTAKGIPVLYSESYFLSEKFEFSIIRKLVD